MKNSPSGHVLLPEWTAKHGWPGLCQTPRGQVSLGQLTAVALALPCLSGSPFCSRSLASRWEEACGSTSLTYMSLLAPRWGGGGWPVGLTLFQQHKRIVLPVETCSRNRVTPTPPHTQGHRIRTCKHITINSHYWAFVFAIGRVQLESLECPSWTSLKRSSHFIYLG